MCYFYSTYQLSKCIHIENNTLKIYCLNHKPMFKIKNNYINIASTMSTQNTRSGFVLKISKTVNLLILTFYYKI